MGAIVDTLLSPFTRTPTFKEFVLSSHRAKHDDHLIFEAGIVTHVHKESHHGLEGSKINRRAWRVFSRAVKNAFTDAKIKQICARYKFDLEKLASSSHPLERRYVEYFGVGSAAATLTDLQDTLDQDSTWLWHRLRNTSVKEIRKIYEKATENSYLGDVEDPKKISGAPRDSHENLVQDYFKMDQQRCNLFRGISELVSTDPNIPRLHPYYSRLSMAITSLLENPRDLEDPALIIPAPGATEGEMDFYRVFDVISGGGVTAVALVPVSDSSYLQPIVSFRCTKQALGQEDMIQSLLLDMEKNIGESGYNICKEKLIKLCKDPDFTRGKDSVFLSYSQGGGPATYLARDVLQDGVKLHEFIAFNIVGCEEKVVDDIAKSISSQPGIDIPPAFTIHRNKGDWVNHSGQKHPGFGINHPNERVQVIEWEIDDLPKPTDNVLDPSQAIAWLNLHGRRPMDAPREYERTIYRGHTACDPILDTYKRYGKLEDARQAVSKILLRLVDFTFTTIDFIFRLFGKEFLRKSI